MIQTMAGIIFRYSQRSLGRIINCKTAHEVSVYSRSYVPYRESGTGSSGISSGRQNKEYISPIKGKLIALAKDVPYGAEDTVFNIGDYGTGDGFASMDLLRELIQSLRKQHGEEVPFQVIYEDRELNDFNSLFRRLYGIIPDPPSYLNVLDNVFPLASGSNFYAQCVPPESMHIIMCFLAKHWLSKRPTMYQEYIYPFPGISKEERDRHHRQAAEDWEKFLLLRSKELKSGGILVVSVPTHEEQDHEGNYSMTNRNYVKIMNDIWKSLSDHGKIAKEEFINTNLDVCFYSLKQLKAPFEDLSSLVSRSNLRLLSAEFHINKNLIFKRWSPGEEINRAEFAELYVNMHKPYAYSTFINGLSSSRSGQEKEAIVDEYFRELEAHMATMDPEIFRNDFCAAYVFIEKI